MSVDTLQKMNAKDRRIWRRRMRKRDGHGTRCNKTVKLLYLGVDAECTCEEKQHRIWGTNQNAVAVEY